MGVIEEIISKILQEVISRSVWAQIGFGLLVLIGLFYLLLKFKREERLEKKRNSQLIQLVQQYPFFSRLSMEFQVRRFCERFFLGWNRKDLDLADLESSCTPELREQIKAYLRGEIAEGRYGQMKPFGLSEPKLFQLLTPDAGRPPTAIFLTGIRLPSLVSKEGKELKLLAELIYDETGRWRARKLDFGDHDLETAPESEYDRETLVSRPWPEPAQETVDPVRMKEPRLDSPWIGVVLGGIFVVCTVAGAIWLNLRTYQENRRFEELRKEGTPIIATVADHSEERTRYHITYFFELPGHEQIITFPSNHFVSAYVPAAVGQEAVRSGEIVVSYDPKSPELNAPNAFQPESLTSMSGLFAITLSIPIAFAFFIFQASLRRDQFWKGWKKSAKRYRRIGLHAFP